MTLIHDIAPALFLLVAALLLFGGSRIARQFGLPEALGCGVALCIIAIATGLLLGTWRATWAGGAWGDRLLTYTRIVGITGMLFLAGTRFDFAWIRLRADRVFRTVIVAVLLFVIVLVMPKFLAMDVTPIVLVSATVVSSSLWYPGEFRGSDNNNDLVIKWQMAALVFTTCAFLVLYFFEALTTAHRASLSVLAYVVLALYEAVKLFVLFGFAYFICSRFLARTQGRVSSIRITIGFVLITVLIFGLTLITTNQLGAFAWAFLAGLLWQHSAIGMDFGVAHRPATSALLMSFAFVPLLLQTHGRDLKGWPASALFVVSVVAIKTIVARFAINTAHLPKYSTTRLAIALAVPGEIAIGFLGFAIARWPIGSPTYFVILGYGVIATVLVPSIWPAVTLAETNKRAPIYQ
ncbi:MAG TPA: hypothetical protein VF074_14750 [Pyrinomonadaceae bacterium]